MKTQKRISILFIILAVVVLGGYFLINNSNSQKSQITYTNQVYGYSIEISSKYIYRESNNGVGVGLSVTDPNDDTNHLHQLSVNVLSQPVGGKTFTSIIDYGNNFFSNAVVKPTATTIDGQPAITAVLPGDSGADNSRGYYILHNNLIYQIEFNPADSTGFDSMAKTFKFTK